jgi:hypothetical protein
MSAFVADPGPARRYSGSEGAMFARLMRVDINHGFYNLGGGRTDLVAAPTRRSQQLIQSLGLLIRQEPSGFSVLYDASRPESLLSYLETQAKGDRRNEIWSRLSIALVPVNRAFVTLTEMPLGVSPATSNFYFSNQNARTVGGQVLLSRGDHANSDPLLPVTSAQFRLNLSPGPPRQVVVASVSGQPVPIPFTLGDRTRPADAPAPSPCYLDFSLVPEGLYTVTTIGGPPTPPVQLLYTQVTPAPICFINLFFVAPSDGSGGVFPVSRAGSGLAGPQPVEYLLDFQARALPWRYNVASRNPGGELEDLSIEPQVGAAAAAFEGPVAGVGPTGAPTYSFISASPLRLQQVSDVRLRLNGRRTGSMSEAGVLTNNLPVAAIGNVVAGPGAPAAVMQVYV